MSSFIASSKRPVITPYDGGDLLEGIENFKDSREENCDREEGRNRIPTPSGFDWPQEVGQYLGYSVDSKFPVSFDGDGCAILVRFDTPFSDTKFVTGHAKQDHPTRQFKYLAILSLTYSNDINIAIRDEAALLQFYRLVAPMLKLNADRRFKDATNPDGDGSWNQGRNWAEIYE